MNRTRKYILQIVLAALICTWLPTGNIWVGISYAAGSGAHPVSNNSALTISLLGWSESIMWGGAAGAAFGAGVGAIVGAGVGL